MASLPQKETASFQQNINQLSTLIISCYNITRFCYLHNVMLRNLAFPLYKNLAAAVYLATSVNPQRKHGKEQL